MRRHFRRSMFVGFGALAMLGAVAFGQPRAEEAAAPPAKEDSKAWSLEGSVRVTSAYFDRGYNLADSGYIFQSEAYLYWNAVDREGLTLSPYIGYWANYMEQKGPQNPKHFDEIDAIVGVRAEMGQWELDAYWNLQSYPAGAFEQIQELTLSLAYTFEFEDSPFTLTPSAAVYQEIQNQGDDENLYFELGLTPAWEPKNSRWSFELPIVVGLSGDGWYQDASGHNEAFGYASAELVARYKLSDNCSIVGGVKYLYLAAETVQADNNGNEHAVVGRVSFEFEL